MTTITTITEKICGLSLFFNCRLFIFSEIVWFSDIVDTHAHTIHVATLYGSFKVNTHKIKWSMWVVLSHISYVWIALLCAVFSTEELIYGSNWRLLMFWFFMAALNEIVWRKCCVHTKIGKIIAEYTLIDNFFLLSLIFASVSKSFLLMDFSEMLLHCSLLIIINYFRITHSFHFIIFHFDKTHRETNKRLKCKMQQKRDEEKKLSWTPKKKRNKPIFSCNCFICANIK